MTIDEKSLRYWCDEEGLIFIGTVVPQGAGPFKNFKEWIDRGLHAGMTYLERYQEIRESPERLLEGTRSVLVFGMPYGQGDRLHGAGPARISQYARLRDYHKFMRRGGERVWKKMQKELPGDAEGRVVVDTVPVLERAIAAQTGRGFIGKNTVWIHPDHGSFFFLGEIFTTAKIQDYRDEPINPEERSERGGCGTCRRCQVHCPTGALDEAYRLDANRCIAYWTIEHRGPIPNEHWPMLKHYIFGCDICQIVCPYNRDGMRAPAALIKIKERPPLSEIATMSQEQYELWFGGSPMTRAKREGLMRNALIAMHQTQHPDLQRVKEALAADGACPEVVRQTLQQMS